MPKPGQYTKILDRNAKNWKLYSKALEYWVIL
jgi:hypothetical protein